MINENQLKKIVAKSVNTILNEMVIDPDMWENPEKYWERIKQHEYEKGPKNWNWIKCQDPVFKRLDLEWIPSEEYEDGIYRDADYHEYYKDGGDLISIEDPESFEDDFDDDDELYESILKRTVSESVRKVLKEHDPHNIPGKFCIYNHHIGTHGVSYGLLGPNKEYFVYDPTKLNTIFCTSQEEAAQKADEINRKLDQEESMSRKRFDDMNSMQEGKVLRESWKDDIYLDTKQLISQLSGKNKAFISRVDKNQREKYGNVDIFSCTIDKDSQSIEICFGDYDISFYFRNGKVVDTYGRGQGHKYSKSLESCAIELAGKYFPSQSDDYMGW